MLDEKIIPPLSGELTANDVVKFFDNVYDNNGNRLTKSLKRTHIKNLMKMLYNDKENNQTTLQDGSIVPIIVARRYEGRALYHYFNTAKTPQEEILNSFAHKTNISYVNDKPELKKEGELIAQEILYLLDDIKTEDKYKKAVGEEKRAKVILLFQKLYKNTQKNVCTLPSGEEIPIIIKRTGENNRIAYYLNSSEHKKEVLHAFAEATDCIYLEYKENDTIPVDKHPQELTARQCAKLFHKVGFVPENEKKLEGKERILQWFHRIYSKPEQNQVHLPDGRCVPLLVRRLSCSQRCLCLNTSNATIKPFVLKKFEELSQSEFCFKNLNLTKDNKQELYKSLTLLALAENKTDANKDKYFYHQYCQRAYDVLNLKTQHLTVDDYLRHKALNHQKE